MTWTEAVAACNEAVAATGKSWEVVPVSSGAGWAIKFKGPFVGYDPQTWGKVPFAA